MSILNIGSRNFVRSHPAFHLDDVVPRLSTLRSAASSLVSTLGFRETTTWRKCRHRVSLEIDERINSHFTGFLRLPSQFDVLSGPVIRGLTPKIPTGEPLKIAVLGCSNGAEAYSIASILRRDHPDLVFAIRGLDISADCVRKASSARYEADEIYNNRLIPAEFVCSTFNQVEGAFVVKDDIARHVRFDVGDLCDPGLTSAFGACDIVFAQNVLFHMKRPLARRALENIGSLLRHGSTLFIDGVDLDLRAQFAERAGLVPLSCLLERIHNEARRARAAGWPYQYWGLEPFEDRPDAASRYATIWVAW